MWCFCFSKHRHTPVLSNNATFYGQILARKHPFILLLFGIQAGIFFKPKQMRVKFFEAKYFKKFTIFETFSLTKITKQSHYLYSKLIFFIQSKSSQKSEKLVTIHVIF
jgi:hypothetical protein